MTLLHEEATGDNAPLFGKTTQELVENINSRDARTKRRHDQSDFRKNTCEKCAYVVKTVRNGHYSPLFCRSFGRIEVQEADPACPKFVPIEKPDEPLY